MKILQIIHFTALEIYHFEKLVTLKTSLLDRPKIDDFEKLGLKSYERLNIRRPLRLSWRLGCFSALMAQPQLLCQNVEIMYPTNRIWRIF